MGNLALKMIFLLGGLLSYQFMLAQHSNEFYNDGAVVHIESGAELHVWGDLHMIGATSDLQNNGLITVQGNSYSDALFQQSGTGTYRIENTDVNTGERQFISGSFAVRGTGTANIGIDDGSFYDLELNNDQGIVYLVGTGNIADVRNSIDFKAGYKLNRIVTHDIGTTGSITHPDNGEDYTGVFGLLNTAAGITDLIDNTISSNGNMSTVDSAYIQGKFRRAISTSGGSYPFVMGLEPAGSGQKRGVQYAIIELSTNSYDVITGYFQSDSSNTMTPFGECSGYEVDYYGGEDSGQWVFSDATGSGSGTVEVRLWPQDTNLPPKSVWMITKDNSAAGTTNDCGPSVVGLDRTGFTGLGAFGVAGADNLLPVELLSFAGRCLGASTVLRWTTASETNNEFFTLEKSSDGINFREMASITGAGNSEQSRDYEYFARSADQATTYYRLSQTDFDGRKTYFDIIAVDCAPQSPIEVSIRPNPTTGHFSVILPESEREAFHLTLFDINGRMVAFKQTEDGLEYVDFDINSLTQGTYFLQVKSASRLATFKVTKL